MHDIAKYISAEKLRDGTLIEVRALRPDDREALVAAVRGMSDKSLYKRFFGFKREFSEQETSRFVDVDFREHVALVAAAAGPQAPILAGARYVTIAPGRAELACAVTDAYQGQGLGKILIRHLAAIAKQSGVRELIAEVLPENTGMLRVLQSAGYPLALQRASGVVHAVMQL